MGSRAAHLASGCEGCSLSSDNICFVFHGHRRILVSAFGAATKVPKQSAGSDTPQRPGPPATVCVCATGHGTGIRDRSERRSAAALSADISYRWGFFPSEKKVKLLKIRHKSWQEDHEHH